MRAPSIGDRVGNFVRLSLGAGAIAVMLTWVGHAAPGVDVTPPGAPPAALAEAPTDASERVAASLGCARSTAPADLDEFFAERRGPLIGWDNPHVTQLSDDRWLWLVHDTYLDYSGRATDLVAVGSQIQNAAFLQEGSCFTVLHGGVPEARLNFEIGDGRIPADNFLWPLGSEVAGDRLWVFWGETTTAVPAPPHGHGISRHPVATWLASYDIHTLERRSFEPAPNSGVDPVYGFAVASDDTHSYLFGNSNQLNLWRNGGYDNGPHSATRMFLARVPLGQFDQMPEYWAGDAWSDDAADATTISERFWAENTMQPRYIDGSWLSVVNRDGFFGVEVWLEAAPDPWGPWVALDVVEHEPRPASVDKNSYQPIILPWSSSANGIAVAISENAVKWRHAIANPTLYRPAVFELDWPSDPEAQIEELIGALGE